MRVVRLRYDHEYARSPVFDGRGFAYTGAPLLRGSWVVELYAWKEFVVVYGSNSIQAITPLPGELAQGSSDPASLR